MSNYELIETAGVPIKAWTRGVGVEDAARKQLENVARLPIVFHHVAVMPDVHFGIGATVGWSSRREGAIIPAAVGVDIGCGMMAVETTLDASQLPDKLKALRSAIERAVPHGRTSQRRPRRSRRVARRARRQARQAWKRARRRATRRSSTSTRSIGERQRRQSPRHARHAATTSSRSASTRRDRVWFMLHSGSRGVGNRIGTLLHRAREAGHAAARARTCPTRTSRISTEGTQHFDDYVEAVELGAAVRATNRELMMDAVIAAAQRGSCRRSSSASSRSTATTTTSRASTTSARTSSSRARARCARGLGDLGIIPGSMGARSYIVRGKGNPESFCSCSHGAGRAMSRGEAKRRFTRRGSREGDRGHRVPQGRGRDRRDADGVQADRRGDGGAGRSRRGRAHAAAGRVREGMMPPSTSTAVARRGRRADPAHVARARR